MQDLYELVCEAKEHAASDDYDRTKESIRALIDAGNYGLRGPEVAQGDNISIWRGHVPESHDLFNNLGRFSYPPPEHTRLGRANLPGSSVFYASGNRDTMLAELAADVGDVVQIVGAVPTRNAPTLVLGDLQRLRFANNVLLDAHDNREVARATYRAMPRDQQNRAVYIDSFFADHFRTPGPEDYALTACFSSVVLDCATHALWYPSVKAGAGVNLAIPSAMFDVYFACVIVKAIRITAVHGYGAYEFEILNHAVDFDDARNIDWQDGDAPTPLRMRRPR